MEQSFIHKVPSKSFINYPTNPSEDEDLGLIELDSLLNYEIQSSSNTIFLYINPKSGSGVGQAILERVQQINISKSSHIYEIKLSDNLTAKISNILSPESIQELMHLIKVETKIKKTVKIIIGGGDGTVLSIVEHLDEEGINLNKCIFGHLPLGTGNDLSNALGFGDHFTMENDNSLEEILIRYNQSPTGKVDVWQMKIVLDSYQGEIIEISDESKKTKVNEVGDRITCFKKSFINYLSIGYDAQVGFGFSKRRCQNRCCNKFLYFWEGLKKTVCSKKNISLSSYIDSLKTVNLDYKNFLEEDDNSTRKISEDLNNIHLLERKGKVETVFNSELILSESSENEEKVKCNSPTVKKNKKNLYDDIILKGDPVSVVFQNINFYLGGTKDIWEKSGSQLGLEMISVDKKKKNYQVKEDSNLSEKLENVQQSICDQKLEVFSYSSGLKVGLEKISTGQADKIHHGGGPFIVKFKNMKNNRLERENKIYLNVDGEFFTVVKPIELIIRLNQNLCKGALNFMQNLPKNDSF